MVDIKSGFCPKGKSGVRLQDRRTVVLQETKELRKEVSSGRRVDIILTSLWAKSEDCFLSLILSLNTECYLDK